MIKKIIIALFSAFAFHQTVADNNVGPLQFLEEKYNELSPKAQFATTAAIGFVGTRIALNTAMGVLKLGAAAFITYVGLPVKCFLTFLFVTLTDCIFQNGDFTSYWCTQGCSSPFQATWRYD